ncbi:MAG: nicotinate-nucleotide adenylyltransferase [Pseudomonadota bacterium]
MNARSAPVGIFGGTFDPVHFGHLRSAYELLHALRLRQVRFMPVGNPPHRAAPIADADLRVRMLKGAIEHQPGFVLDDREVRRSGLSYSVDSLESLREELDAVPICLLLGMDSFLSLPKWYRWRDILKLAHVVVAHRPGWKAPSRGALGNLLRDRGTELVDDLHKTSAGAIYIHEVTQLEISSSSIRTLVSKGIDPRYLLPERVRELLDQAKCYSIGMDDTASRNQTEGGSDPS